MKLLVADDHAVVLAGLAALLRGSPQAPDVLGASDISTALQLAAAHPDLDVALVDLMMPGLAGADALGTLAAHYPRCRS